MTDAIRHVLVWRGNRIGDVVLTFPALKIIRSRASQARITYVTTDYARELAEISGLADTVYALKFEGGIRNLWRYRRLRKAVRAGAFERIFIYGKTDRYRRRIGPIEGTFRSEEFPAGHKAERLARAVIKGLGLEDCAIPDPQVDLADRPETWDQFASLGVDGPRAEYIVMHPGSHSMARQAWQRWRQHTPDKTWPPEKYVALIEGVRQRWPRLTVALVGSAQERSLVEARVEQKLPARSAINLCGRTRLPELLQLLKHARAFLGGDSGVMHLASAAGTPMVVLFGPTNEHETGPYAMGERATILRAMPYEHAVQTPDCMDRISVEQVWQAVQRRLDSAPPPGQ